MAGILTHMAVASEISKRLPEGSIHDMALFYLGNLAPDAIQEREGYIRAYKKHTHFREDIMDRDFSKEENRSTFHKRLSEFIIKNWDRKEDSLDLYRGFVVHNLVDELYILTLRQDFVNIMEKRGIDQSDILFYKLVIADMIRNDLLLYANFDGMEKIRQILEQVPVQSVDGYVNADEIDTFRKSILKSRFYKENEDQQPVYISFEKTKEFVQMAAEDVVKKLSDDISFPRMFTL